MNPDQLNPTVTKAPPALAEDDYREPTKAELLEELSIALREALAGVKGRPALEVLDELDREMKQDANSR